ncbi:MAG: hypothetical protein K5799_10165 [Erythrobacter sp.]|nr:hypothetical protein [Erythrobacter sp.]
MHDFGTAPAEQGRRNAGRHAARAEQAERRPPAKRAVGESRNRSQGNEGEKGCQNNCGHRTDLSVVAFPSLLTGCGERVENIPYRDGFPIWRPMFSFCSRQSSGKRDRTLLICDELRLDFSEPRR